MSGPVLIRPATVADLDGIVDVHTRALTFYLRRGWQPDGDRRPGPGGADYVFLRLTVR